MTRPTLPPPSTPALVPGIREAMQARLTELRQQVQALPPLPAAKNRKP